ncbi:MAG: DUF5615 family PIN-like protein [Promethearchaeota archaeon]
MLLICDAMLGDLARSLRFFGFDTLFVGEMEKDLPKALPDMEILELARRTGRIILTKDELFSRVDPAQVILLTGSRTSDYMEQLVEKLKLELKFNQDNSRCFRCNEIVVRVAKDLVKDRVKDNTYKHYDTFYECKSCGQVFWRGSHFSKDEGGIISRFSTVMENGEREGTRKEDTL